MTPPVASVERASSGPASGVTRDRGSSLAAALPFACAVHCAATPILVATLPALAFDKKVEIVFLALSVLAAVVVTAMSWRLHRQRFIWALIALGAVTWAASLSGAFLPIPEGITDAIGGGVLALGIFLSTRLAHRRRCERCSAA